MAAARRAMAAAAVVLAALSLLLVGGGASYADCYDYCFKDCMSKDKNMRDYCSYACDKTCSPDAAAALHRAALSGVVPVDCQFACVRESCRRLPQGGDDDMEACYGQCYNGCKATKAGGLPRPLRAGTGAVRPAPALHDDHPFHEKQDDGAAQAAAERDPDGVSHPAVSSPVLP
ncbi:hypothetical protein U9M48_018578 [Paspalum notatum var. saurae]|uniref:Uncharacterized protein n=1 Tax=Paspalum notatum var. saurae TaxID=547442 RepID=A0AAQ3TAZ1_PASNO